MPRIAPKNEALEKITGLFSRQYACRFSEFVAQRANILSFRFPLPDDVKKSDDFIFFYDYFPERDLIVINAFKQQKDEALNFGRSIEERQKINQIYNDFLDTGKNI